MGVPITTAYGVQGYAMPKARTSEDTRRRVTMVGSVLFYLLIISNVLGLLYALFSVPPDIFDAEIRPLMFVIPYPPFLVISDYYITGYAAVAFFIALALSIFISLGIIIGKDMRPFAKIGGKLLSSEDVSPEEEKEFDGNSFTLISEMFMANIAFNIAYVIILAIFRVNMETPDLDDYESYELMFALARASVWEELITRIAFIGIPLIFLWSFGRGHLFHWMGGKEKVEGRKWYNYLFGGGFEVNGFIAILIIISSLLFALAHISSWDAYKVVPTFVGGLALGYLFVKKGVHASIILHFAIDYLTILPEAIGGVVGFGLSAMIGLSIIVLFALGIMVFYKYALGVLEFITGLTRQNVVPTTGDTAGGGGGPYGTEPRYGEPVGLEERDHLKGESKEMGLEEPNMVLRNSMMGTPVEEEIGEEPLVDLKKEEPIDRDEF